MSYDILIIALILYLAVMFVFAILYLNDWKSIVNVLGLGHIKSDLERIWTSVWKSRDKY